MLTLGRIFPDNLGGQILSEKHLSWLLFNRRHSRLFSLRSCSLQKLVGDFFLIFSRGIWEIWWEILAGILRDFFLTHRMKAQKFRGKFRSIFRKRKFVAQIFFRAKFTLQICHLNRLRTLTWNRSCSCICMRVESDVRTLKRSNVDERQSVERVTRTAPRKTATNMKLFKHTIFFLDGYSYPQSGKINLNLNSYRIKNVSVSISLDRINSKQIRKCKCQLGGLPIWCDMRAYTRAKLIRTKLWNV